VEPAAPLPPPPLLLLFFQPSSPPSRAAPSPYCTPSIAAPVASAPFYLPVVLLTPRRPVTLLGTRAGVALKGLAQFSTATPDASEPPDDSRANITTRRPKGEKITGPLTFSAQLGQPALRITRRRLDGFFGKIASGCI
jgi:hypothetical protein